MGQCSVGAAPHLAPQEGGGGECARAKYHPRLQLWKRSKLSLRSPDEINNIWNFSQDKENRSTVAVVRKLALDVIKMFPKDTFIRARIASAVRSALEYHWTRCWSRRAARD